MITDEIYELALLMMCHVCFNPHIQCERQVTDLCLKIKICGICIWLRTKRRFLTGGGSSNIRWCCLCLLQLDPDSIGCYRWERYIDVISVPLHAGPMLYFVNLVCDKQFSNQQGLLNLHILFGGINQNDCHTPCLYCGHTPVYDYAKRQVMVLSLLN